VTPPPRGRRILFHARAPNETDQLVPLHNLCEGLEYAVDPIRATATQHVLDFGIEAALGALADAAADRLAFDHGSPPINPQIRPSRSSLRPSNDGNGRELVRNVPGARVESRRGIEPMTAYHEDSASSRINQYEHGKHEPDHGTVQPVASRYTTVSLAPEIG